jgi:hypothetical protein
MYGYPPYNYGRPLPRMHLCPGCGMQTPYGYSCGGCSMAWDPATFLLMELEAEFVEEVVEEVFDDGVTYDGDYDSW